MDRDTKIKFQKLITRVLDAPFEFNGEQYTWRRCLKLRKLYNEIGPCEMTLAMESAGLAAIKIDDTPYLFFGIKSAAKIINEDDCAAKRITELCNLMQDDDHVKLIARKLQGKKMNGVAVKSTTVRYWGVFP